MKPEEFILQLITAYREARVPILGDQKLHRGRSRSISSTAEDLFAYYLIKNDKTIERIFIDQPMYFPDSKMRIYPDLAIVKQGVIKSFIDLKMDMGWKRKELLNLCKTHGRTINRAKGGHCYAKDGQTKANIKLRISPDVSYSITIINQRNSGTSLGELREQAKKLKPHVETFLLCRSDKYHTNEYKYEPEDLLAKLDVDKAGFRRLLEKIR